MVSALARKVPRDYRDQGGYRCGLHPGVSVDQRVLADAAA